MLAGVESTAPGNCALPAPPVPECAAMLPDVTHTKCYLVGPPTAGGVRLTSADAVQAGQTWWVDTVFTASAAHDADETVNGCFRRAAGCP